MTMPSDVEARTAAADADAKFGLGMQLMAQADSFETFERAVGRIRDRPPAGTAG